VLAAATTTGITARAVTTTRLITATTDLRMATGQVTTIHLQRRFTLSQKPQ